MGEFYGIVNIRLCALLKTPRPKAFKWTSYNSIAIYYDHQLQLCKLFCCLNTRFSFGGFWWVYAVFIINHYISNIITWAFLNSTYYTLKYRHYNISCRLSQAMHSLKHKFIAYTSPMKWNERTFEFHSVAFFFSSLYYVEFDVSHLSSIPHTSQFMKWMRTNERTNDNGRKKYIHFNYVCTGTNCLAQIISNLNRCNRIHKNDIYFLNRCSIEPTIIHQIFRASEICFRIERKKIKR